MLESTDHARQPVPRIRRSLARGARLLVVGLVSLCLLEVTLQILALGIWLFAGHDEDQPAADDRVILCVGDSFTYGTGASTPGNSYPSQLERIMREELGPEWRVINGGWPSQNSRQVLEVIDDQLEKYDPELVCVLVGFNDLWSQPLELELEPVSATERSAGGGRSFRWELRTPRLWKLIRGSGAREHRPPATVAQPPTGAGQDFLIGSWTQAMGLQLTLRPDGTGSVSGVDLIWEADGGSLSIRHEGSRFQFTGYSDPPPSTLMALVWEKVGEDLVLRSERRSTIAVGDVDRPAVEARFLRATSKREPLSLAEQVFVSHLRQLVTRIAARGSQVVFLGYPHVESWPREVMSRLAADLQIVEYVPVDVAFRIEEEKDPSVELFVPDTHCNDAGYRIMAEAVAERLTGLLRGR